jgi:hypothetical protein
MVIHSSSSASCIDPLARKPMTIPLVPRISTVQNARSLSTKRVTTTPNTMRVSVIATTDGTRDAAVSPAPPLPSSITDIAAAWHQ